MHFEIEKEEELSNISEQVIENLENNPHVLFYGEMGAGKTSLIKNICKLLKVKEVVNSPTYSLVNEYEMEDGRLIYHFDLFRIKDLNEALDMGIEEYLDSGSLCFIEWPQLIESILEKPFIKIEMQQESALRSIKTSICNPA